MNRVIIVGGGMCGLVVANLLANAADVIVVEKKRYPFHRVCGEYISNETIPFLKSAGLFPSEFNPPSITRFQLTSVNGKSAQLPLDLGGFGISRYTFDDFLYRKAAEKGVRFLLNTEADQISFEENQFHVRAGENRLNADIVIGSFGKRSRLDVAMKRMFIQKRSPYAGVKYHIRTDLPSDLISLHNFKDGYCGVSQVEDQKFTLCYLTHSNQLKHHGGIKSMEESVLYKNPFLKSLFINSQFLYEKPEVINEISFTTKRPIENHVLMAGDAAGMIAPLCGNGMALAMHSAKAVSELIMKFLNNEISREQLEKMYWQKWNKSFARRLWAGRQIQQLFGAEWTSNLAVNLIKNVKPVADFLIRQTHGAPF
jgi:flavin-dependent dehydrogenase